MTARAWAEMQVEVAAAAAEGAAEALRSVGAGGLEEREAPAGVVLVAYLPADDHLGARAAQVRSRLDLLREAGLGDGELRLRRVPGAAWERLWREHFHPVAAGPVVIKPPWSKIDSAPGQVVVEINPGMAFGTGSHPTTLGCLRMLSQYLRRGALVIDVGTGSGVLAIAAAKLGAGMVIATDIDQMAVTEALKNARRNRVANRVRVIRADLLEAISAVAQVALANLVAEQVIELAPQLSARLEPDGLLIASGILAEKEASVVESLKAEGGRVCAREQQGEWVTLAARWPENGTSHATGGSAE